MLMAGSTARFGCLITGTKGGARGIFSNFGFRPSIGATGSFDPPLPPFPDAVAGANTRKSLRSIGALEAGFGVWLMATLMPRMTNNVRMRPFKMVDEQTAQGFVLTVMRLGVGKCFEVNSSGGSLCGKSASRMSSQRVVQMGCSSRAALEKTPNSSSGELARASRRETRRKTRERFMHTSPARSEPVFGWFRSEGGWFLPSGLDAQ